MASTTRRRRGCYRSWLFVIQIISAVVDGLALSTVVVHAVVVLQLSATAISLVMAGGATAALLLAPAAGGRMDRLGLPRAAAVGSLATAVALLGYATASSVVGLAVAVAVFMTAQALSGAARQGMAVADVPAEDRLQVRAAMHTLLNAGLGAGTVLGAALIAVGAETLSLGYLVAAAAAVVVAGVLRRLPSAAPAPSPAGGRLLALRDRRMALVTGLAVLVQLTMPILSVLLPVWVVLQTTAPPWIPAAALGVNTALVIGVQRWWTRKVTTTRDVARSAGWAALGLIMMGVLLVLATAAGASAAAAGLVVTAVVALTVGEVAGGAAVWQLALGRVPPGAEGRYQATFSMSASAARVLGPLVALPLVVHAPRGGWVALAIAMAAANLAVAATAQTRRAPARRAGFPTHTYTANPAATHAAATVPTGQQS